jgi:TatD DNase family protein
VPRDLILVETDAPYLTPVPLRGRPNAPYLVPHTMRFMAEVLDADLDELCAQVAGNTLRAYGSWADGLEASVTAGAAEPAGSA